jgi:hypothetical protein
MMNVTTPRDESSAGTACQKLGIGSQIEGSLIPFRSESDANARTSTQC